MVPARVGDLNVNSKMIEITDIARLPGPGLNAPHRCAFSPNGQYVSYLWAEKGGLRRDLWIHALRTGASRRLIEAEQGVADEKALSFEEQMARERERERGLGITSCSWSPNGDFLLVNPGRELMAIRLEDGSKKWSIPLERPIFLPTFSPDKRKLAFVSGGELWSQSLTKKGDPAGSARRLTHDATDEKLNGMADQHTWEELGRQRGFWWLPDSRRLIMASVETDNVPPIYILDPAQSEQEIHRYSFAGGEIPNTDLFIVDSETEETRKLAMPDDGTAHLVDVSIHPDGRAFIQRLDRAQRNLTLLALDVETDAATTLFVENGFPWINIFKDLNFIHKDGSFLRLHERENITRIEKRDPDGAPLCDLAAPEGMVHGVVGVDEDEEWAYYIASGADPRERHVFRSNLHGLGSAEQLTSEPGCHAVVLSPDNQRWVHTHDSVSSPPRVVIEPVEGGDSTEIRDNTDPLMEALDPRQPELVSFFADDETTLLYGALYHPRDRKEGERRPLIVAVYGGPGHQAVQNSWALTADLRARHFAQKGYLVLKVDNRGSRGRGRSFETPVHLGLGRVEVDDQATGVRYLTDERGLADPDRIGVYGWSYGGYMALMCLARRPDFFKAAAAGAPVVRWEDYDALYTERYMGVPEKGVRGAERIVNEKGYRESSVLAHLAKIQGRLLVIHGMKDENVLMRHTLALMEEAARLHKNVDLLMIPGERHAIRDDAARENLEKKLFTHLDDALSINAPTTRRTHE